MGKPLGLVSLHPRPLRQNPGIPVVFQRKMAAAALRVDGLGEVDGNALTGTAMPAKAWYGRAGRSMKSIEYYDT